MKKKRILIIGTSIIITIFVIAGLIFFKNGTKNKMVIRVDGWDMEYTEPKGRVKGISIGKGQAFHGIGAKAEKDFEDLELLELLETARAQETEDLEFRSNLTSQQVEAMEAYEDFLEDYVKNYDGEEFENSRGFQGPKFTLIYLNDDEIPELVIVDNLRHPDGANYYIYEDGEVAFVGEYGQYGGSSYAEKGSIIFGEYDGAGFAHYWTYRIEGTKEILLQSSDLYIHWYTECEEPEYTHFVDDKEVSKEEYLAAHKMWDDYEEKIVSYDKCFLMRDGNIRENLDQAMAELMYEEDLLAYWRVLSNQQPFVSTNEGYYI